MLILCLVATLSTGQLLCGGLFSHDPLSNWFSSVALSHALIENPAQREQLLRVMLAAAAGNTPVTLLHQVTMLLQQVKTKVYIYIFFINGAQSFSYILFQANNSFNT